MAYFNHTPAESESYTRHFPAVRPEASDPGQEEYETSPEDYDDGFDELMEDWYPPEEAEEDEGISEEEALAAKRRNYRIAAGFGDFGATLVGVLVILALVAFLINMLRFVSSDFNQNFSLWATKF